MPVAILTGSGGMSTAVFVHGTGVSEPAFSKLFRHVPSEWQSRQLELAVERCYSGDSGRARLWQAEASVPTYDTTRAIVPGPEDAELALRDLLPQDSRWELRVLATAQMLVFLSPLDGDPVGLPLLRGVTAHPARREPVTETITRTLPEWRGDPLWLFWAELTAGVRPYTGPADPAFAAAEATARRPAEGNGQEWRP